MLCYYGKAARLGDLTKEEYEQAMDGLGWSTLGDAIAKKDALLPASVDADLFMEVYAYVHSSLCPGQRARNAPIEEAIPILEEMFSSHPNPPGAAHGLSFVAFLRDYTGSRVITRDQWNLFLEFAQLAAPDLSNFTPDGIDDGSWPSLIDEYVAHARHARQQSPKP